MGPVATDGSATVYLERNGESGRETTKVETVTALSSYNLPFQKKSTEKQLFIMLLQRPRLGMYIMVSSFLIVIFEN